ncbi:SAM-dependent methyltransferase [Sinosporangium siamense]|uniref:SAM-dependent methyltransferase n=1 Tax=Sinosporangium siamense TaxID=1367973 RepID=UPI0035A23D66
MNEGPGHVDLKVHLAHPARMYDYYLGGKDNFAADREAAEKALAAAPEIRAIARENRAFMQRAVTHIVSAGIRQFLDIGTGLPTGRNVHEVAQDYAPDARVAYVDNDRIVQVHARALLSGQGRGETRVIAADIREPDVILNHPDVREMIDFTAPVAIMLVSVLQFVPDRDPEELVAPLREAMAPGSYLVLSHPTHDFRREQVHQVVDTYNKAKAPAITRTRPEIERLFGDLEMIEPGLVQVPLWRPEPGSVCKDLGLIWMYGGVARKPA